MLLENCWCRVFIVNGKVCVKRFGMFLFFMIFKFGGWFLYVLVIILIIERMDKFVLAKSLWVFEIFGVKFFELINGYVNGSMMVGLFLYDV